MKKLYLHMGFHKTGSTSFQETCKRNQEKLTEQGFCYPLFNSRHIGIEDIANHGNVLYSLFMLRPEEYSFNIRHRIEDINALIDDFKNGLHQYLGAEKLIISGEALSLLPLSILEKLKIFFEKHDYTIIPIACIRSPYAYNCSSRQQGAKVGNAIDTYYFHSQVHFIENVRTAVPNTCFFAYDEASSKKDGVVGFLYDYMGIDSRDFEIIQANTSASNIITRVQARLNEDNPLYRDMELNPAYMHIMGAESEYIMPKILEDYIFTNIDLESLLFKERYRMTKEEYARIEEACNLENFYLEERLGKEFTDRKVEFVEEDALVRLCIKLIDEL